MATDRQSDSKLITEIYDYLKSKGFLEQLRLECIADVKQKPAYKELKHRICNFLTQRLSNGQWSPEKKRKSSPTRLKEQIAECGLLAMTVERVVDEVVSLKLHQHMRPMLNEIVEEYFDAKNSGKKNASTSKVSKETVSEPAKSVAKTSKLVEKICESSEKSSKKIFSNEDAKKGDSKKAAVTFENEKESRKISKIDEKNVQKKTPKRHISESESSDSETEQIRERSPRKRKPNPKYSSEVYQSIFASKEEASGDDDGGGGGSSSSSSSASSEATSSSSSKSSSVSKKKIVSEPVLKQAQPVDSAKKNQKDASVSNSKSTSVESRNVSNNVSDKIPVVQCHKLADSTPAKKIEDKTEKILEKSSPDTKVRKRGRPRKDTSTVAATVAKSSDDEDNDSDYVPSGSRKETPKVKKNVKPEPVKSAAVHNSTARTDGEGSPKVHPPVKKVRPLPFFP